ncbi:discoidin domain-containing protein [Cyclobacterium plantarum]|uniref:Coagulation factor 5/8 type domain-containing protein n=1 Tax=Cyclobacterium plantarum TaxID=2716263 RepID=A0ABX0H2M7_9BACT|nr:discoidin domain-containing protein [Cyclobacterium plantarum]NHE56038.1 coagulation factor 5/8 type domain-containing protein [Cyclobacterium plantarum]
MINKKPSDLFILIVLTVAAIFPVKGQNNLSLSGSATASSVDAGKNADFAIDGNPESYWSSGSLDEQAWLTVRLPGATEVLGATIDFAPDHTPNGALLLQYLLNGEWRTVHKVANNESHRVEVDLEKPLLVDRIRIAAADQKPMQIGEFILSGQQYKDSSTLAAKPILVNQSGYNLSRPKRFTAPGIADGTAFHVVNLKNKQTVFTAKVKGEKGDFSAFNPQTTDAFEIQIKGKASYPFRIGPYWMERVTYRNMVDFMLDARHYVGNVKEIRPISFAWRDGDFFNWSMQSLVAMYHSNPFAYERMEIKGKYVPNEAFPDAYRGLWGELLPFKEGTPDIIQLMHWDADVKISQQLDHEMQKAELAHFLYAWPYLKKWLPRQNFDKVYQYAISVWEKAEVSEHSLSQYDKSPEHNLLHLKTQLGTTKGEMPPGFSVIPNLMMYEVSKRENDPEAGKYFDAAYRQMDWMIQNLDWQDPMTTKGQRMSEHMTMRAFAYFYTEYPERSPAGLKAKVADWAKIALSRSGNMWDFRKYDEAEWTPPGWNETGNILGFPAAAFAAMTLLGDKDLIRDLEILAWSHLENAFGRNPTGRHFSFKGPQEIEGVDLGWYSRHKGGIGLLDEVPFVFDGSPKSFHYPNYPEAGDVGWTEGWVQFNTAFNISMAYLANYYTRLECSQNESGDLLIRLVAPLNFYSDQEEQANVQVANMAGNSISLGLKELSAFSLELEGRMEKNDSRLEAEGQILLLEEKDQVKVSYGYGFFEKSVVVPVK